MFIILLHPLIFACNTWKRMAIMMNATRLSLLSLSSLSPLSLPSHHSPCGWRTSQEPMQMQFTLSTLSVSTSGGLWPRRLLLCDTVRVLSWLCGTSGLPTTQHCRYRTITQGIQYTQVAGGVMHKEWESSKRRKSMANECFAESLLSLPQHKCPHLHIFTGIAFVENSNTTKAG